MDATASCLNENLDDDIVINYLPKHLEKFIKEQNL